MKLNVKRLFAFAGVLGLVFSLAMPFVAFADGPTLSASQWATGYWHTNNAYSWSMTKTANPSAVTLATVGSSATVNYTLNINRALATTNDTQGVSGMVAITNNGSTATTDMSIVDNVQYQSGSGTYMTLVSANVDTSAHPILAAGETYTYPYDVTFIPVSGATYNNDVVITATNSSAVSPLDMSFTLPGSSTPVETDASATISDGMGGCPTGYSCVSTLPYGGNTFGYWMLSGSQTETYSVTITNSSATTCGVHSLLGDSAVLTAENTGANAQAYLNVDIYSGDCPVVKPPSTIYPLRYWMNNAKKNPNLVDKLLPTSIGSLKVTSAKQVYDILSARGLSNINRLKAQLLTAELNVVNGASNTSIASTITTANNFLDSYGDRDWSKLTNSQKNQALDLISVLRSYNRQDVKPKHNCK